MPKVLDHGFVELAASMGTDADVVAVARNSYGKETRHVSTERELIRFLMRHDHSTPFEAPVFRFHQKLPIFVARQQVRHRTAVINEVSARYSVLPEEFYVPERNQVREQSKANKQGRGEVVGDDEIGTFRADCEDAGRRAFGDYADHLNELGVARELARINLPLSAYTEWTWQINLRNLLHFLSLRCDPHAQYEMRVYADAMLELIRPVVPLCVEAWEDYDKRRGGLLLSAMDIRAVKTGSTEGMTKREVGEWEAKRARLGLDID